jgi:hypothetical protein
MPEEPSRAQVVGWLDAVQVELNEIDAHIAPYLDRRHRLEGRQALLKDLLSSFEAADLEAEDDAPAQPRSTSRTFPRPVTLGVGEYVRSHAEEILRAEGPMHINDLHARFLARGLEVPGAGEPVNLIVHLRKDPNIVAPARGMYALHDQVDVASLPSARRSKKRSRRPKRKGA